MRDLDYEFSPRLQKLVDLGETGLDIMHGELKNLMLISEQNFQSAQNGDPLDADEYDESDSYHNGRLDALTEVYQLTYDLSFAISDKERKDSGEINERNQQ
jgi:hypothetical protein